MPTPINEKVYELLKVYFLEAIETSPDAEALYDKFQDLVQGIDLKTPPKVRNDISDMFMNAACHYGDEMFKLGIMIGRDPSIILELPDHGN